ncbi:MAG: TIR domain-containing protein [Hyphomicrobiales bacterium]|nr:TIR domain-containing protein [Hyphomicrobiales bacterium]
MARIFVSHSNLDNAIATDIMGWLRASGFDETFLDIDKHTGIPPGTNWERTLYREIDSAHAVILILTSNWLESKWCFAEFTQARALGKAIFPVIVAPGGERFVAPDIQQLDLRQDREGGLEQLGRELTQLALDTQGGFPWDAHRPPYPGLLSFEAEDAAIFFGRDDDVRHLIERLSARRVQGAPNVIALLGASGSGKSSLMRAGVLPRLERDRRNWIILPPFRPRRDPVGEFARSACEALGRPEEWRDWRGRFVSEDCASALDDLTEALQTVAGSRESHLLIAVDQFEELFTVAPDEEAARFLNLLETAADDAKMCVTLLSLRSDFLGRLQQAAEGHFRFAEFSLGPMALSRVRQIIEGPAGIAGLKVDEALVVAATKDAGTEDALPLLAFTLRELYDRYVGHHDADSQRLLSADHYALLGDQASGLNPLENSVRRRADEVLSELQLSDLQLAALREAFVGRMVRIDDEGEYFRRPAYVDSLPDEAIPVLERLARARLVIFADDAGRRIVEPAHEALLRKWPRLRGWLDEERDFLIGRMQLDRALQDWERAAEGDKTSALLQGLLLNRAREWLDDHPTALNEPEKHFIQASSNHATAVERRRRLMRRALVLSGIAIVGVMAVAGGLIWTAQQRLELAERETVAAERGADATLLALRSRDLLQEGDPGNAAVAAVQAMDTLSTNETRSSLLGVTMAVSPNLSLSIAADLMPNVLARVSGADEVMIGGLDGRLHAWPIGDRRGPRLFAAVGDDIRGGPNPPAVRGLAMTGVGGAVVAVDDGRILWFDAAGALVAEERIVGDIDKAAIAADGGRVLAASQTDQSISVVSCEGGVGVVDCDKTILADGYATVLQLDGSASRAALALQDRQLLIVDLKDLAAPMSLRLDGDPRLRSLAFEESGGRLAAGSIDGRLFLIDASANVKELPEQEESITAMAWRPDQPLLAVTCDGFAICIWDLGEQDRPAIAQRLLGHANTVMALVWSADGNTIVSTDIDGVVKRWSIDGIDTTVFALEAPGEPALTDIDVSPDGGHLAAGTSTGAVVVWQVDATASAETLQGPSGAEIRSVRWHPTKPWIAAADEEGRVVVWDRNTNDLIDEHAVDTSVIEAIRWLPDGKGIVAATLGGEVRLWILGGETVDFSDVHPEPVLGLAVVPEAARLLSVDAAGNLWLWDLETRVRIPMDWAQTGEAVDILAVSHDGKNVLAAGNGGVLFLYRLDASGDPRRIDLDSAQIDGAAWTTDDRMIAAVDTEGRLKVWSIADDGILVSVPVRGAERLGADEPGHFGHLRRMTWLSDDSSIAVATSSGKVVVAKLDPVAWRERITTVFPSTVGESGR